MAARDTHAEQVNGELRLVVCGSVQSVGLVPGVEPHGYWTAMVPDNRPEQALVLGIGGGTVAHLLWQRYPELAIIGIDDDQITLELARNQFGLETPLLRLQHADAADFVRGARAQFDLVIVDLFVGEAIAEVVNNRRLQRGVRSLAAPGGTVIWNLHRDRRGSVLRRRVGSGLLLRRRILVGLNLVLHLHRRRRRRREQGHPSP